jgi:hypothetical protein
VVVLGGRLVLAAEHLGREQERAAVDGWLVQVGFNRLGDRL